MGVLKDQTNQLDRVTQGVDEVESNLKQAEKQLRSIARRIATDKIFMGLMVFDNISASQTQPVVDISWYHRCNSSVCGEA